MDDKINRYKHLITPVLWEYKPIKINSYIPEPTEFHYNRGFINRYFVRKMNDSNGTVYEVDVSDYSTFKNNPRYVATEIIWRISKYPNDKIKEFNRNSIFNARNEISNIHLYLVNLDQFYKDIDF